MSRRSPEVTQCYNPSCGITFTSTNKGTSYCTPKCAAQASRARRKLGYEAYWAQVPAKRGQVL